MTTRNHDDIAKLVEKTKTIEDVDIVLGEFLDSSHEGSPAAVAGDLYKIYDILVDDSDHLDDGHESVLECFFYTVAFTSAETVYARFAKILGVNAKSLEWTVEDRGDAPLPIGVEALLEEVREMERINAEIDAK